VSAQGVGAQGVGAQGVGAQAVASEIELPSLVARIHLDVATGAVQADAESIAHAADAAAPWLSICEVSEVVGRVIGRVAGLGEVEGLLHDDDVTDVLVDGPGEVMVERGGCLEPSGLVLDVDGVATLVEQLARIGDRRVDSRHPIADVRLPGGFRVNIAVAPVAVGGPYVSIRRFRSVGSVLSEIAGPSAELISRAVAERRNVLVCGATGAGKTTLLAAMVECCDPSERLVVVEDVAELPTSRPLVRLEAQPSDGEGRSAVSVRVLLRAALRMRPDRLVIGEVRGAEAVDLVHALGTGHRGSMATVHSDGPASALRRLELLCAAHGSADGVLVRHQLLDVVDLVVHVERAANGERLVTAIGVVEPSGLRSIHGEVGEW